MLGGVVLVAGPIVAGSLTSGVTPHVAAVPVAAVTAPDQQTVRVVPRPMMIRFRTPAPPSTPAPAPTATPVRAQRRAVSAAPVSAPASKQAIVNIIMAAAARWGVSGSWMVSIAKCESGLNPHAVNPSGPYDGLFQFLPSTFAHNGGTNIWDPTDQANITAKMLAHGQAHQWSCA